MTRRCARPRRRTCRQGVTAERDGPIVRLVGQHRGFISSPSNLGVDGAELVALIARQRDSFAARGEAVEWRTRGYDQPATLVTRPRAHGFVAEEQETVLVGLAEEMTSHPVALPEAVVLRRTTDERDMHRIAAMESAVWGHDMQWLAEDLIGRVRAPAPSSWPRSARSSSQQRGWSGVPGPSLPRCEAARLWRGGAAKGSTGRSLHSAPGSPLNVESAPSRSTHPTPAARFSSGWASWPSPAPRRMYGHRADQTKTGASI